VEQEKYTQKQEKTARQVIKYFAKLQASVFLLSSGKLWNKWPGGYDIMVVRTEGAKSKKVINIPLIYVHKDGLPILVASMGGMPNNPSWYYNVKANPKIEVTSPQDSGTFIAEELSKDQKEELWPLICSFYPDYETYQNNTSREIPVFLCKEV